MDQIIIRTSQSAWLKELSLAYKGKDSILLIDDANVGINPSQQSIFQMGLSAKLSTREIVAVCVALGMTAAGIAMVVLAFVDPEPTSKLGLLVGGGIVIVATGGGSAIYILVRLKPPRVRVGPEGFEITWE